MLHTLNSQHNGLFKCLLAVRLNTCLRNDKWNERKQSMCVEAMLPDAATAVVCVCVCIAMLYETIFFQLIKIVFPIFYSVQFWGQFNK